MHWSFYKKKFPILSFYIGPILSGVLLGISYIPFLPIGMFFALVPLWFFIFHQKNLKQVLIGTWICQFITTLIGFNWLAYTVYTFGDMSWISSILILLVFCSFSNIFMVVSGGLWFILSQNISLPHKTILKLILLPILFTTFHSLIPNLFPWHLGYVWIVGFPALHTAEIWGFRFLSTLLYIFNLLFLILYQHKWDKIGRTALGGALSLFLFLNIFGFYLQKRLPQPQEKLNIILVQENIGQFKNLKLMSHFKNRSEQTYSTLKNLTYRGLFQIRKKYRKLTQIDFILWAEGAYPYTILKNQSSSEPLSSLASRLRIPILTGGSGRDGKNYSNSLFIFDRKGIIKKPIYDKMKLLAFGEYIPMADRFPFIKKFFPYFSGRFVRGKSQQVVNLEGKKLGLQICYDSLFDRFTRRLALDKAQVLINITNDSWYGSWQEPWQHLLMSSARAIELRRPFIRATNTGFSTVVQSNGTVMKISPLNKPWSHFYSVPYSKNPPRTLFMTWGFYINEIFLFLFFIFSLLYIKFLS